MVTFAIQNIFAQTDFSNSFYHSLLVTQLKRIQQIQNALARAVTRTRKHSHITPALRLLHWLTVAQRIQYKFIYITNNLLHKSGPFYLRNHINIKHTGKTRYSGHFCLSCQPLPSSLNSLIVPFVFPLCVSGLFCLSIPDLSKNSHLHLPHPSSHSSSISLHFLSRYQFLSGRKTHFFSLFNHS